MQCKRPGVTGVRIARGYADLHRSSGISLSSHHAHRPRHVRHRTTGARERSLLTCSKHTVTPKLTTEMRGKALRVTRPARNAPAKVRGHQTKVHQIFNRYRGVIAMLVRASILRSSYPLWNVRQQNEDGVMPIFADWRQNRLP